jgi:hypothetical protein
MRKINGVPFTAHIDLSSLTGGEVIKWDSTNTLMAWEDQDSTGYVLVVYPWGDRGIFAGGRPNDSSQIGDIDYISISTPSTVTDFGDLTQARWGVAGCSSGSRGCVGGGAYPYLDIIDYITISTTGDATDFGNLTQARFYFGACSNLTTGIFGGGYKETGGVGNLNIIDYITIATIGNATDFGDLTSSRRTNGLSDGVSRGVFGANTTMDYITIGTPSNATDFGDLNSNSAGHSGCASSTRGLFAGGQWHNQIDYITIATTGNATDFGDLTATRASMGGASDGTIGVWAGGDTGSNTSVNIIEYVTISTTGNSTDFGDLSQTRRDLAGLAGD